MKKMGNKGFTLIELLAVIVVLAIVAIIGYATVLPLLAESKQRALATEAQGVINAAENLSSMILMGERDGSSYVKDYGYCYTIENLVSENVLKMKTNLYKGYIKVKKDGASYTYKIALANEAFKIAEVEAKTVGKDNVTDAGANFGGITSTCPTDSTF